MQFMQVYCSGQHWPMSNPNSIPGSMVPLCHTFSAETEKMLQIAIWSSTLLYYKIAEHETLNLGGRSNSALKSTFRKGTVHKVLPNMARFLSLWKGVGGWGCVRIKRRGVLGELLEHISVVGNVYIFLNFPAFIYSIGRIVITTGGIM